MATAPFYNQTTDGLYLEFYYNQISSVWTPWGSWGFGGSGSGSWREVTEEILDRLGAQLYKPAENNNMGTFGPIYKIHKIDDLSLPEPVLCERHNLSRVQNCES